MSSRGVVYAAGAGSGSGAGFLATAAVAPIGYLLLIRLWLLQPPDRVAGGRAGTSVVVLTLALGLSLSVLWEFAEWAGDKYIDSNIGVGYEDPLGDLAAGAAGSIASGTLLATNLPARRRGVSVNAR